MAICYRSITQPVLVSLAWLKQRAYIGQCQDASLHLSAASQIPDYSPSRTQVAAQFVVKWVGIPALTFPSSEALGRLAQPFELKFIHL